MGYGYPLGQGSKTDGPPWPLEVPLPGPAVDVGFSGYHGCAVVEGGDLYCWGWNGSGQLGLGYKEWWVGDDEKPEDVGPVDVGGPVVDVELGHMHTCVLLADGVVRCFGAQRQDPLFCGAVGGCDVTGVLGTGQDENIGDDEVPSSAPPVELGGAAVHLESVGSVTTCAIRQDGALFCWGIWHWSAVTRFFVGDDETPLEAGPVEVGPVRDVEKYCYQGLEDGRWRCWWPTSSAYAGAPGTVAQDPLDLDELLGAHVVEVERTAGTVCARLEDNSLRCWGEGTDGQLGYGPLFEAPKACDFGFSEFISYGVPCNSFSPNTSVPPGCCVEEGGTLEHLPPVPYE